MTDATTQPAPGPDDDDAGGDGEGEAPELSAAVRVASALGLVLGGVLAAPAALIGFAYLLDALGVDDGSTVLGLDFGVIGTGAAALVIPKRWRAFGIGAVIGVFLSAVLVVFYAVLLNAGDY